MDERKVVYTNGFRTTMGMLETQLVFKIESPVIEDASGKVVSIQSQDLVDLRMSPAIAKQLCVALGQQIAEYEKNFGQIKLPEQ